jgi:hypothetical protein
MWFVLNIAIFWDTSPYSPYVNRRFGGMHHLHLQGRKSAEQKTSLQQVFRQTLKLEDIRSSETAVHIQTTRRYIPEDDNVHNYRCENLKAYT